MPNLGLFSDQEYLYFPDPDISVTSQRDRKHWDKYVEAFDEVGDDENGKMIYWDTRFPFLFVSNRDYVLSFKVEKIGEKLTAGVLESSDALDIAEKSGKIRAYAKLRAVQTPNSLMGTQGPLIEKSGFLDNPG